jgi:hypothetical protein
MSVRIPHLIAATILSAAGACAALALAGPAAAFPDAKVETQTRPDFGLLIKPHLRHHRHHGWGGYRGGCGERCEGGYPEGGYPGGYGPPDGRGRYGGPMLDAASVDCNDPEQGAHLSELVEHMNPGGTLIVKPGAACVGTLFIDKPITIEGQGDRPHGRDVAIDSDHAEPVSQGVATLLGPPGGGMPCIVVRIQDDVASDTRRAVVLRNIALQSDKSNDEACLDIEHGVVRLETTMIDYQGHGPAVYVGDGVLISGDPRGEEDPRYDWGRRDRVYIQAPLAEEAIEVEGGQVQLRDTTIVGGQVGINFESIQKGSTVQAVALVLPRTEESGRAFDPGSTGVAIGGHGSGGIAVRDSFICGYGIGVFIESANVLNLDNNAICQAGKGVYAAGGQFSATNNLIAATNIGIQIGAGSPIAVTANSIYGTANEERRGRGGDYFIYVEPGGQDGGIHDNFFYSGHGICSWRNVDDDYFKGRRRPGGREWHRWRYMPRWHANPYGYCKDPQDFRIDEEYSWFGDNARQVYGSDDSWPSYDDRVGDPYDHYDWNSPWRNQPQGPPPDRGPYH